MLARPAVKGVETFLAATGRTECRHANFVPVIPSDRRIVRNNGESPNYEFRVGFRVDRCARGASVQSAETFGPSLGQWSHALGFSILVADPLVLPMRWRQHYVAAIGPHIEPNAEPASLLRTPSTCSKNRCLPPPDGVSADFVSGSDPSSSISRSRERAPSLPFFRSISSTRRPDAAPVGIPMPALGYWPHQRTI